MSQSTLGPDTPTADTITIDVQPRHIPRGHSEDLGPFKPYTIGGNNFRLIAEISYLDKIIIIDSILTHAEYDKENWKK